MNQPGKVLTRNALTSDHPIYNQQDNGELVAPKALDYPWLESSTDER